MSTLVHELVFGIVICCRSVAARAAVYVRCRQVPHRLTHVMADSELQHSFISRALDFGSPTPSPFKLEPHFSPVRVWSRCAKLGRTSRPGPGGPLKSQSLMRIRP